jgi:hypothetical protein
MSEIMNLVQDKHCAIMDILEMTRGIVPSVSDNMPFDDRSEFFCDMYESREAIFADIRRIDGELINFDLAAYANNEEFVRLQNEMKSAIAEIMALDKGHAEITADLANQFRDNIRKLRQGANISNAYSDDFSDGVSSFDHRR